MRFPFYFKIFIKTAIMSLGLLYSIYYSTWYFAKKLGTATVKANADSMAIS